jgi:hypothetical protein
VEGKWKGRVEQEGAEDWNGYHVLVKILRILYIIADVIFVGFITTERRPSLSVLFNPSVGHL